MHTTGGEKQNKQKTESGAPSCENMPVVYLNM